MKRILLTGVNGQVGQALQQQLAQSHHTAWQVIACDRRQLDLSNPDQIRAVVRELSPHLIINPAAYTAVDKAESEPELAYAVNAVAPGVLAEEAARLQASLIHFSTDYVYDGTKPSAYLESDDTHPSSIYGASKLAGELAIGQVGLPHLILRTSWVYGSHGKNFLKTIIRLAQARESLHIVADQYGAPTADHAIAQATGELVMRWQPENSSQSGIYHLVNAGETSWHGFATEIVRQYRALEASREWPKLAVADILPIETVEYPTPAKRPENSRLSTHKLKQVFGVSLPEWTVSLNQVMAQYKAE